MLSDSFYFGMLYGVQPRFLCLRMLMAARDMEHFAVFSEIRTCLMEYERNIGVSALAVHVEHPVEIKCTGVFARFSADRHFLYNVWSKILP